MKTWQQRGFESALPGMASHYSTCQQPHALPTEHAGNKGGKGVGWESLATQRMQLALTEKNAKYDHGDEISAGTFAMLNPERGRKKKRVCH